MCGDGGGGGDGACEPGYGHDNPWSGAPVGSGGNYNDLFCGGPGGDYGDWP